MNLDSSAEEGRYKSLFEQATDAIMITDFTGNFLDVNSSLCKLFGYTKEQLLKMSVHELIDSSDLDARPIPFDRLMNGEQQFSERRMITKDGRIIHVEANVKKLNNEEILAIARDVSNLYHSRNQLRLSEAHLNTILDNTNIAFILLDKNLKVITYNKEAKKFGQQEYHLEENKEINLFEVITPAGREYWEKMLPQAFNGEPFEYEIDYVQPDGRVHWYYVRVCRIDNNQGEIYGIMIAIQNITEQKEMNMQQEQITDDLSHRNHDLEQFAYIVSHNLRAPVANIIGATNLLQVGENTEEDTSDLLLGLSEAAAKLDTVIQDLNTILQLNKELKSEFEFVDFRVLLDDITESIHSLVMENNASISGNFEMAKELRSIKSYIYSIFYNLISNSIKYSKPDLAPVIQIQSYQKNGQVILEFRDNGLGIDLNRHGNEVFGLYKRFHIEKDGKGVGLFMVKTQVERLGGKVSVESIPNQGSVFRIEIPQGN
ncbi:MAG: PAS domain S-box protein [Bacteroidetes bacterium]|nr:PAS domain S-box protein [Bacteroidota bacterium]